MEIEIKGTSDHQYAGIPTWVKGWLGGSPIRSSLPVERSQLIHQEKFEIQF